LSDNFSKNAMHYNKLVAYSIFVLKKYYRSIFFYCCMGLVFASLYISQIPDSYRASAKIRVTQITSNPLSPIGINIEEPSELLVRLRSPSTYGFAEQQACGGRKNLNPANVVTASIPRGTPNIVDITVHADSQDEAMTCATSIFEFIKSSQWQILQPFINNSKLSLEEYKAQLSDYRAFANKKNKPPDQSDGSLLNLGQMIKIQEQIFILQNILRTSENRQAVLISPIYVDKIPKVKIIFLIIGLFCGGLSGFLIGLGREKLASKNFDLIKS
jgi:hypothetical protein